MAWQVQSVRMSAPPYLRRLEVSLYHGVLLRRCGIAGQPAQHLGWGERPMLYDYSVAILGDRLLVCYGVLLNQLESECLFDILDAVEFLPCEQLDVHDLRLMVAAGKGLLHHLWLTAHVAVGCRLKIHRLA